MEQKKPSDHEKQIREKPNQVPLQQPRNINDLIAETLAMPMENIIETNRKKQKGQNDGYTGNKETN